MSMLEFDSRYIMPVLTNHGVGGERIRDQYRLTEHRQNLINEQEGLGSPRSRAAAAAAAGGGGNGVGNGMSSSPFHRVRSALEDMEGASSLELKTSSSSSNGRTASSDDEGNNSYSEDTGNNHEAQSHQRLMRSSRNTRRPTPVTSPTSNHSRNKPKVHVVAEEIAVI
jgi:hypothetical protein